MSDKRAVLVMAYGTPKGLGDVAAYYTDIRHGRPPPKELLDDLVARYEAIGGRSPLLDITEMQRAGLEERLGMRVYLGQKHAAPFISDAVESIAQDDVGTLVGLVLAPHYSKMSIGDYQRRVERAAADTGWSGRLEMIDSWHLEPGYIDLLARRVKEATALVPEDAQNDFEVVFTAHSLPERILQAGDPYADQLRETGEAVARAAGLERWRTGWQSAGRTDDPWLGPDLLEILDTLADEGRKGVVVCPCGFVSDHLEVLYDVDIEAQRKATELDIALSRTVSPNDDPEFIDLLTSVVQRRLEAAG
jgi:ferrochelatase